MKIHGVVPILRLYPANGGARISKKSGEHPLEHRAGSWQDWGVSNNSPLSTCFPRVGVQVLAAWVQPLSSDPLTSDPRTPLHELHETLHRTCPSDFGQANLRIPRACRSGRALDRQLSRRRNLLQDRRGRPRPRRVHRPAHLPAGQRKPHGTVDHDRELQAGERRSDHGRDSLFRLRPAGSQRRRPRADHGQAGGQPDHPRRRRPRAGHGPARRPNSGFFRHSRRPPLRRPGDRRALQGDGLRRRRVRGRQPRRGEHQAGAGPHGAAGRAPGHHRQTPQHAPKKPNRPTSSAARSKAAWP